MTSDTPERQQQIDELLGAVIVDPDPDRTVLRCDDCRTPVLAALDELLSVVHDPTCPTLLAMPTGERVEVVEETGVIIVHVAGERPA